MTFHFEAALARGSTGLAGFAGLWRDRRFDNHVSKLLQAIELVSLLIAISLRRDDQIAIDGNPVSLLDTKAGFHIIRHAFAGREVPTEDSLGSNLVDVLSSGTAGADEGPMKLSVRDAKVRRD